MYIIEIFKRTIWTLSIIIYIWLLPGILNHGGIPPADSMLKTWIKIFTESFLVSIILTILWNEKYKKTSVILGVLLIFIFFLISDYISQSLIWIYVISGVNLGVFLSKNNIHKDFIEWIKSIFSHIKKKKRF